MTTTDHDLLIEINTKLTGHLEQHVEIVKANQRMLLMVVCATISALGSLVAVFAG